MSCTRRSHAVSRWRERRSCWAPGAGRQEQSRAVPWLWLQELQVVSRPTDSCAAFAGGGDTSPICLARRPIADAVRPLPPRPAHGALAPPQPRAHGPRGMLSRPSFAPSPLSSCAAVLTDEALASLVEHGYLVVDGALAPSLCRKPRGSSACCQCRHVLRGYQKPMLSTLASPPLSMRAQSGSAVSAAGPRPCGEGCSARLRQA